MQATISIVIGRMTTTAASMNAVTVLLLNREPVKRAHLHGFLTLLLEAPKPRLKSGHIQLPN